MKKWQKAVLSLVTISYLIGLLLILWPRIVDLLISILERFNLDVMTDSQTIIRNYGIGLLILTVVILFVILFTPGQRTNIPISRTKQGRLALSNAGISHFIRTQLSGEGLSNIKVTVKNTRRHNKFYIVADSVYRSYTIEELPRITNTLTMKLTDLLAGVDRAPIKVDMQINQATKGNRKTTRVI